MGQRENRRQQRQRGRLERQRLWPAELHMVDLPDILDPPAYLEEQRGKFIKMLETIADGTDDLALKARICLDLLRLSSMGRSRVDLSSRTSLELPDLSHLSVEELERIIQAGREPQGDGGAGGRGAR